MSVASVLLNLDSLGVFHWRAYFTSVASWPPNGKVVVVPLWDSPHTSFCLINRANFQGTFYCVVTVSLKAGNGDFMSPPSPGTTTAQARRFSVETPTSDVPPRFSVPRCYSLSSVSVIILWDQSPVLCVASWVLCTPCCSLPPGAGREAWLPSPGRADTLHSVWCV